MGLQINKSLYVCGFFIQWSYQCVLNVAAHRARQLVFRPRRPHHCHGYWIQQISGPSISCPVGPPNVHS